MRPEEREKKLLLYWSGELNGAERAEVEEWLAAEESAACYVEDLELLRGDLKALPDRTPASGQVDRALKRHLAAAANPVRRLPLVRYAAIAAMFLVGFGLAIFFAIGLPSKTTPLSVAAKKDRAAQDTAALKKKRRQRAAERRRHRRKSSPTRMRVAKIKERIHALRSKYVH